MPPQDRPQISADPALRVAQLKAARATLAASIPSDEDFEAQIETGNELQRAQRKAAQDRLAALDEEIAKQASQPSA